MFAVRGFRLKSAIFKFSFRLSVVSSRERIPSVAVQPAVPLERNRRYRTSVNAYVPKEIRVPHEPLP